MNKIYKVIWSKVKSCYIVVSELANRVSRSSAPARAGRASLAAVMAAAALTAGTIAPSSALAADDSITPTNAAYYAAIGDAVIDDNPFVTNGNWGTDNGTKLDGVVSTSKSNEGKTVTVKLGDDREYIYNYTTVTDANGTDHNYWIREGFGVKAITERYHPDAKNLKLDLYIKGQADYNDIITTGEHTAAITDMTTAVNGTPLDELAYVQYAAITNSASTEVADSFHYYIKQGEQYKDVGVNAEGAGLARNFYVFRDSDFNDETGKYRFNGQDVEYGNIYQIDGKVGVFLTKQAMAPTMSYTSTEALAAQGSHVYGGTVYGLNNEVLVTGYNNKTGQWSTVWAAEVTDPNATIQSMTLNEFNEIMHHLHLEDVKLAQADIVGTVAATPNASNVLNGVQFDPTKNDHGGGVGFLNKASNVAPGFILKGSGGTGGNDTSVTVYTQQLVDSGEKDSYGNAIYTYGTANEAFTLNTGSVVTAGVKDGTANTLSSLTINGQNYILDTGSGSGTPTPSGYYKPNVDAEGNLTWTWTTIDPANDITPQNIKGADGAKGDKGDQGEQGPAGVVGPQGPQGEKGDKGDTGAAGPQGEKGDKGDTGAQGLQGDKGADGKDGQDGADGKSAYEVWKEVTNNTTATETEYLDAIKGADGKDGVNGKDGANGVDGQDGKDGVDGKDGADGKSAYEVWKEVTNNTTATETEYLDAIKGEKGDKGDKGEQGASGKDGINGVDGQDGADGKSAYEVWKEVTNNTTATETEYLDAIKGADGKDGKDGANGASIADGTYAVINNEVSMPIEYDNGVSAGNVTITDIASKADITTLQNHIDNINTEISILGGEVIDSGTINSDGTLSVHTNQNHKFTFDGKLTDERLTNADYDSTSGTLTLTTTDKYTPTSTHEVTVSGIASKDDITALNNRVSTNETNITNLDSRVSTNETNITNLDNRVSTNETNITNLQGDVTNLDNRVSTNETNITNLQGDVTNLDSRVTTNETNITNLDSRVSTNETNITNLQGDVTNLDSRVTTNETNITNLDSRVSTNETNITNLQGDVTNLDSRVSTNETNITNLDNRVTTIEDTMIVGGDINETNGSVTLTKVDGTTISIGNLCDSRLDGVNYDAASGEMTFTVTDHYDQDNKATIVVGDIASKTNLDIETAERKAEDASLSNRINEEAAQRQAEDASLSNRINVEAAQRQAEDASLSNRINVETAQRQAEDASLSNRINVETAQRQAEDASLSNRISQEVSDRIANDITAGNIDETTGTVTLTKNNGDIITVGNICDSRLDSASFDAAAGKLTFTVTDHYNQDAQKTIEVNDIASKTALENEAAIRYNYDQAIINDYTTKTNYLDNRISSLSGRVDKVGAGAAALAALHPLDFDPDDKLSFAAGVGNYSGATAAAIGAFYRPNERVMFSIGGTTGNGENMVNAGVSFALGKGGKINNSRVAMAHEINDLRQQVAYLTAMVAQLSEFAGYQFNDLKPFPDTPDNHWAYEYVAKLAAEGIVEGYPDGNFDGSRAMTRYEFAAMLYRALEKGFRLDARIIDEFEPELGRLSVERIRGEQNQKNKIERVRINDSTPDRDAYGGKISVGKTWP